MFLGNHMFDMKRQLIRLCRQQAILTSVPSSLVDEFADLNVHLTATTVVQKTACFRFEKRNHVARINQCLVFVALFLSQRTLIRFATELNDALCDFRIGLSINDCLCHLSTKHGANWLEIMIQDTCES